MAKVMLTKRGKYWQYRFEIASVNGKRKWMYGSGFKTKKEAEKAGNVAQTDYYNTGNPFKASNQSYSDYLDYWVSDYCSNNLRYNTIQTYKTIINLYLKPKLGKYRLSSIDSATLNKFINDICNEKHYRRSYYKNIVKVIKASFRDALGRYNYIKVNPSLSLTIPRTIDHSDYSGHIYTDEEMDKILERFKDDIPFVVALIVARLTGMRTGEVFALTWDNIDFDNGLINIRHSVYDEKKDSLGRWYIGPVKTPSGYRTIPMGKWLTNLLVKYKSIQQDLRSIYGQDYNKYSFKPIKCDEEGNMVYGRIVKCKNDSKEDRLLFTRVNGKYVGTDLTKNPYDIIIKDLMINARFYDNRGTFATKLSEAKANIMGLKSLMGHSGSDTIEKYYINSTDKIKKSIMNKAEKILITNEMRKIGETLSLKG